MMSMVLGKEAKKRRKQKYMQQQQMLGNPWEVLQLLKELQLILL